MDMKLELVPLPVTDVDRAKHFYTEQLGFRTDVDEQITDQLRVVQLTPPGSHCSIFVGSGVISTPPGSVQGLHLVVDDIGQARDAFLARGVPVEEIVSFPVPGRPVVSYAAFTDPDGNGWTLQEIRQPD
jgi:catechol 2,3-dioxygenase-like lactoylglutathione lyase family enzyme